MSNKDLECELENAVAELKRLEAENQRLKDANRWIPTSERLPKEQNEYWVTKEIDGKLQVIKDTYFLTISKVGFYSSYKIVAWREIQEFWDEPYQGDL